MRIVKTFKTYKELLKFLNSIEDLKDFVVCVGEIDGVKCSYVLEYWRDDLVPKDGCVYGGIV